MRPFFSYYGGKWRDAPAYPAPEHRRIIEPFAGSAGYAVRYPDRDVVLCDLDPIIVGVWSYLIRVPAAEVLALPDLPEGGSVHDLAVPQEARWLIGFWLNKATVSPCVTASAWMRSGLHAGSFWGPGARHRIASQVDSIRHWRVMECSYDACPAAKDATWFVDPPYKGAGRYYRRNDAGIDFAHLAEWCRSRPGQVIVCENVGADWLPFVPIGSTKTARRGRRSEEAVWCREGRVPAQTRLWGAA